MGRDVLRRRQGRDQRPMDPPDSMWAAVVRLIWRWPSLPRWLAITVAVAVMGTYAFWTSLPDLTKRQLLTYVGVEGTSSDLSQIAGEFYAELAVTRTMNEANQIRRQFQQFADAASVATQRPEIKNGIWTYPRGVLFASSDVSAEKSLESLGEWIVAIDLVASPESQAEAEDKLTAIKKEALFFLDHPAPAQDIRREFHALLPKILDAKVRRYDPSVYRRIYHRELDNVDPKKSARRPSRLKGTLSRLPLNASALWAFNDPFPSISDDRVFRRWNDVRAFKKYWARYANWQRFRIYTSTI